MDPLIQTSKAQICNKHNQPVLLYNPDPIKGAYCLVCMQENNGLISVESQQQKLNLIINQETEADNTCLQLFQEWYNTILNHKNSLIMNLDKFLQIIDDQMKIIRTNIQKLQQLNQTSTDYQETIIDIQMNSNNFQKKNQQVKVQVKQQLLGFYNNYLSDIKELINYLCQKPKIRKFQYELIKEYSKEEKEKCLAFAFNKENNILFVACRENIIVYEFNNGLISKEIQRLTDHTDSVYCLYFMNQTNQIVSGSDDKSIIIWGIDRKNNKWFNQCQLQEHQDIVSCLAMNKRQNLLISGSVDTTIKFWNKIYSRWSIQQTITVNQNKGVFDINLNEKENKLISSLLFEIKIIEKGGDKIWMIVQTINTDGFRLCFTVGDLFAFQPYFSDKLELYDYDQVRKQFNKVHEVQIPKCQQDYQLFPCQYIQKLSIVSVKQGVYLNIFQINSKGNYTK